MRLILSTARAIGSSGSRPVSTGTSTPAFRFYSSESSGHRPPPLAGVTVVSLEQAIAAPFCTRQLADLGARVNKIERPGVGDFARQYDTRVKALNLKEKEDLVVLKKLLERADVFVQNLAPGADARLGLTYEALKELHPTLIKAYDLLIQSEAGMLSVTGSGKQPAKVGISIADISAGMYAYTNILSALIQRDKDGQGCQTDISMLESMIEWMGFPMYYAFDDAPGPVPAGASHASIYPYGPFKTDDGLSVMLGIQNEREWVNFCRDVLFQPELAADPRFSSNSLRTQNRDELKAIICLAFSELTAEETVARLDKAVIANANVNDMDGVWQHAQLKARDRWSEVQTPAGFIQTLLPPGATKSADQGVLGAQMGSVPRVGEHNRAILAELGLSK
ncbi:hypothetical protein N7523_001396 [Penicillium sp. IBT 18751x]|nr:hypothetical protein N7523_001396 [Penicillium sp. IBT 18751x]